MRLVGRVSRLEERSPAPSSALDLDFSLLNDDELRVIASLPLDGCGDVNLKAVPGDPRTSRLTPHTRGNSRPEPFAHAVAKCL